MRRHRFYLPELRPGIVTVVGSEAQHLSQVLRVATGSDVRAFDGRGHEADGRVLEVEAGRLVVELGSVRASEVEPSLPVTVAVSLLKGDKLSTVVRGCTELGAVEFRPVWSRNGDVQELSRNKLERLRRVAREAAKQSGRAVVPPVHDPVALSSLSWRGRALVGHPGASSTVAEASPAVNDPVTIITGPEGGFSEGEVEELRERGALAVGLGARILRADTAPLALLASLLVPRGS